MRANLQTNGAIAVTEERELLRTLAPHLAEGARRGLLVGEATEPDRPEAPGLVLLTETFEPDSLTPGVERWLSELPGADAASESLPPAVLSVAGQALRTATAEAPDEVAFARVLTVRDTGSCCTARSCNPGPDDGSR
jgi:hypothetical protein